MSASLSSRLLLVFIELWLSVTIVLLLIASAAALRDPGLLIHIGLVEATGLAAVCATAIPAIGGVAALVGLFQRRASGPVLLLLYSLFWLVVLVGGMLAGAWRLGVAGMADTARHTWLVGGVMFATMLSGFLVLVFWSFRHLARGGPRISDY